MAEVKSPPRPKKDAVAKATKPKPTATPSAGSTGQLAQKGLLYLARVSPPPAISNEPADLELAVRHVVVPK